MTITELLGRDYWLVMSIPAAGTTTADIQRHVDDHLAWLLKLEADGTVFLSGPLTGGPDAGPGSGITVLRAGSAEEACAIAGDDPFVRTGLRVNISLGTGDFEWV